MSGFEMVSSVDHGWLTADAPRSAPMPKRNKGGKPGQKLPLPGEAELKTIAHVRCADHVKVDGLTRPVCIVAGADRDQVIAEARELAGLE